MKIELKKFGNILTSRQDGKEALAAIEPQLQSLDQTAEIVLDFQGVITLTPSWADEFLTKLTERYGNRVHLVNTDNPSIEATLSILKRLG